MEETLLLRMTSSPEVTMTPRSRQRVAETMPETCLARAHDVQVITSELVANAVEHARTNIEVRLRRCGASLRVEVDDDGDGWPMLGEPGLLEERGRGLLIVEASSDRWGVDRSAGDGKTTWAEITCW